jgi:hypothetical protein
LHLSPRTTPVLECWGLQQFFGFDNCLLGLQQFSGFNTLLLGLQQFSGCNTLLCRFCTSNAADIMTLLQTGDVSHAMCDV